MSTAVWVTIGAIIGVVGFFSVLVYLFHKRYRGG